ncbi:MAG TPA: class I SAM-dependent methyltransferase [Blastocatellia bacterium]|nr:class I SAM-dependent methyltransferase [Blastocatellia bacterium]
MRNYTGPHDYFDEDYVREWARSADDRRPFRAQFFDAFTAELQPLGAARILELGSGPGFLAEHLLNHCEIAAYDLLDFSPHMLALSRARLAVFGDKISFHQGSFLEEGWWKALPGPFDAVISMQAVHEVRQAERLAPLYGECRLLLKAGGLILIADKRDDEAECEAERFTPDKHLAAFSEAGFKAIRQVYAAGDLFLFAARD